MSSRPKITRMSEALAARINQDVVLTLVSGQEVPCRIVEASKDAGDSIVIEQAGQEIVVRHSHVVMVRSPKLHALAA